MIFGLIVALALGATGFSSQVYGDAPEFPRARLTPEEFDKYLNISKADFEKMAPCYAAYSEFNGRIQYWSQIFRGLIEKNELRVEDFEKIDFSLPGDPGFGGDPENEFFNPEGKFKAPPIPQEVIDDLTTVKNTRLIFNLRGWLNRVLYESTGSVPPKEFEVLVVIIPNVVPKCLLPGSKVYAWYERSLKKQEKIDIAPDNKTVVEDKKLMSGMRFVDQKQRYYISSFASRPKLQRGHK